MKIEYLNNKDISHIDRVPQIVREKHGFYRLMELLSEYVDESSEQLYNILKGITQIVSAQYSPNIDINYLRRLIVKCGISIDYLSLDLTEDGLKQLYFTAIQGFVVGRLSDGSKHNLTDLLQTIFGNSVSSMEVVDKGIETTPTIMSYSATLVGVALVNAQTYFSYYIKPAITGVNALFTFISNGNLSAMPFTEISEGLYGEQVPTTSDYSYNSMSFETGKEKIIYTKHEQGQPEILLSDATAFWVLELK